MAGPTAKLDTLLQGYRIGTDTGDIAFCGVNLVEGVARDGTLTRIVVDTGHTGRRPALQRELAARGLSARDIDVVVCTHAHWDHVENLNIFDRAKIVLHHRERRYITNPHRNDFACPNWINSLFDTYQERITEVEEGSLIIPGVEVVDAPGHSAGTIAVKVDTAEGVAVITGDSVQNSTVAAQRRNALVFWDDAQASRTIDKLVSIADVIYPGHDQAFRIDEQNNVEYVQQFALTLTETAPDQPGLSFDSSRELKQVIMPGIEEQRLP